MSLITRLATASLDVSTARNAPQITGLYAGEDLDLCAPCYIKSSDGKVYMCDATADNEAAEFAGFSPRAVSADEPVTLFGLGTRMRYASSLTPGDIYYVGATAGRLDTTQQVGDSVGVAMAVSDTDIVIIRSHPNYPSGAIDTGDIADDAITLAKMDDLAQGSIIVGGVADAPTALDASTSGQILVGDGTDLVSVAVSGDATLAADGTLTIAADAVDDTMIDWGTGAGQVSAADIPIADAGSLITATEVEAALQELATKDPGHTFTGDVTGTGDHTNLGAASVALTIANDAVTLAKMANLARGSIIVGGVANEPTALDAKTTTQILVGDGTDLKSVAVSGDATLANTGALTIAALAVTVAKTKVFFSTEQTGNGSAQNVAHGLGAIPAGVLVVPSDCPDSAWALAQGAHDATNVVVTATNLLKYYVMAWA